MKAGDIMSSPVVTVAASAEVGRIGRLMLERRFDSLPVVDDNGEVLGIVTRTDLVAKHAHVHVPKYLGILGGVLPIQTHHADDELRKVMAVTAGDLMSDRVHTVGPEEEVEDIATVMVEERTQSVLVADDGGLAGIVTRADIIRLLLIEEADPDDDGAGS